MIFLNILSTFDPFMNLKISPGSLFGTLLILYYFFYIVNIINKILFIYNLAPGLLILTWTSHMKGNSFKNNYCKSINIAHWMQFISTSDILPLIFIKLFVYKNFHDFYVSAMVQRLTIIIIITCSFKSNDISIYSTVNF